VTIKHSYSQTSMRLLFVTTKLYGEYILGPPNIMVAFPNSQ